MLLTACACACGAGWDEVVNQRRWPDLELVIGECERCGSTVSRPEGAWPDETSGRDDALAERAECEREEKSS